MAVPKQKSSKGRTKRRRSHHKIELGNFVKCSHCGKPKLPHRMCSNCGYYKDKEVVDVLEKLEKKKKHKR